MTRKDPHFRLRIPEDLKLQIETMARENSRSITAEIVDRLQRSFAVLAETEGGLAGEIEDIRDRLGRIRDAVIAGRSEREGK